MHDVKFGIILLGSKSETIIDVNEREELTKEDITNKLDAIYEKLTDVPSDPENDVSAALQRLVEEQIIPSANNGQGIVIERHVFLIIDSKKLVVMSRCGLK